TKDTTVPTSFILIYQLTIIKFLNPIASESQFNQLLLGRYPIPRSKRIHVTIEVFRHDYHIRIIVHFVNHRLIHPSPLETLHSPRDRTCGVFLTPEGDDVNNQVIDVMSLNVEHDAFNFAAHLEILIHTINNCLGSCRKSPTIGMLINTKLETC